ncbi:MULTISPECIES: hypothetical protein [unclassified Spirosoma]|uniref:hypothetical protein n=1 Tax=unclassified Spirosoma TaxID=2621999 RepID=UPI00095975B2|nr:MULTISPECIES: hypothetical protein [unclassified Spirosoma]MBN8824420.1 hypothetical protein [Spirosoma sp.]OJW70116.1 MAG: hypothetical protein BGO59_25930 [Spirosoma sp. 48-14]
MAKKVKPSKNEAQTITISGIPGLNNWANISSPRYNGPLPDFTGQLRCLTGVQDMGKDRIILIKPEQLEAKKAKYPQLQVMETVR